MCRSYVWFQDVEGAQLSSPSSQTSVATMSLWMGPRGSTTGIHQDYEPLSMLHQVVGTKEVTLYHRDQHSNLYGSNGKYHISTRNSPIDNGASDVLEHWPLFSHANGTCVLLQPGDALHIPMSFWHTAKSITASISVGKMLRSRCQDRAVDLYASVGMWLHSLGLHSNKHCMCHAEGDYTHREGWEETVPNSEMP